MQYTSLGDILNAQMAKMESTFTENMGNMESELREAISLSAEGSIPSKIKADQAPTKSKTDQAQPTSKTIKLQQKKRSITLQQRKSYFLRKSLELVVLGTRMLELGCWSYAFGARSYLELKNFQCNIM